MTTDQPLTREALYHRAVTLEILLARVMGALAANKDSGKTSPLEDGLLVEWAVYKGSGTVTDGTARS